MGALAKPCCSLPSREEVSVVSRAARELSRAEEKKNFVNITVMESTAVHGNLPSEDNETTEPEMAAAARSQQNHVSRF